ncbi:Probable prolyl 4-hydroxylase [Seminavis robusta]|uniref:Probable prolyl 4-hydroxylase n=1 Tax=Seminavis robusta TaxID=568900 RepID=A0A9N8H766_9STRA|nr:Probable prolyl 4-hydroxylase [Seminavis robusta]|eukprot:Sro61_g035060.1 Probable prolyl 4-hydroxylase (495) ;mRNA; r:80073-82048
MMMKVLALGLSLLCRLAASDLACSVTEEQRDPALKEMTYDIGYGEQTTLVYVEPDMDSMYNGNAPAKHKVVPKFNGLSVKFINMSNKHVRLSWEPRPGGTPNPMNKIAPFEASGTASFPTHSFIMTDPDTDKLLQRFAIQEYPENIYAYDPYIVEGDEKATEKNLNKHLSKKEKEFYRKWRDSLAFNEIYRNFTGRSYLANYLRDPPRHFLWSGEYFGQTHWVETSETHFVMTPPKSALGQLKTSKKRSLKEGETVALEEYRAPGQATMNMTLKVLSVAPRVFEIPNFLSQTEVDHILDLAGGVQLSRSSVGDVGHGYSKAENKKTDTRTSFNAWVQRGKSPIVDAIYRRAADLMRIDEALLRNRDSSERPDWPTKGSLAEHLQLVHYDPGQEYTAHHDFGFSDLSDLQGARFATLLLYLNDEGLVGGETTFPRWVNAETFDKLKVKPEEGKAVLFYSQLPDGNLDDFSQHSAEKPRAGEKWLINLWTWDPKYH